MRGTESGGEGQGVRERELMNTISASNWIDVSYCS